MKAIKVIIVREGDQLSTIGGMHALDALVGYYTEALRAEVVETSAKAKEMIERGGADRVIFISDSMGKVAEEFAATFPKTRVFVFTDGYLPPGKSEGRIKEGEAVWVSKMTTANSKVLQDMVNA